jgi:hypothetical protein
MPTAGSPPAPRPAVVILLPVWGARYVTQFLDLGLRTLLAPGNIPALAEACDCTFRILTRSEEERDFHGHPMFRLLARYCTIEFAGIDDLVFPGGQHSATITLAYVRGMRASGPAMTQTYFVFLVADYIMANGSLGHLLRHIHDGVSGVTAGNFQIVKEAAETVIKDLVRDPMAPLSVQPRALLRIALDHLHPVVFASMPGTSTHTIVCNRVFWRAGSGTLVARFYLRHMLCIRPETDRFDVGSSCDYSFIPEMCASGRVVAVADSDDYCVIEMQPRLQEGPYLVPGRLTPRRLAGYLGDWTTAEHRRNAHTAVVFHTDDIAADVAATVAESEAYVRRVESHLPAVPQSHRGHPFWLGALRAGAESVERIRRFGARAYLTLRDPDDLAATGDVLLVRMMRARQLYERSFRHGRFPCPWHPAWFDGRREARAVLTAIREPAGLVVAGEPTVGSDWAARHAGAGWQFLMPAALAAGLVNGGPFSVCLLYLNSGELSSLPDMLRRIRPHLAANARTVVVFGGGWQTDPHTAIARDVADWRIERIDVVRSLAESSINVAWMRILRRTSLTVSTARWIWAAIRLAVLAVAALASNLFRLIVPRRSGPPTSVFVMLREPATQVPATRDGGDARA